MATSRLQPTAAVPGMSKHFSVGRKDHAGRDRSGMSVRNASQSRSAAKQVAVGHELIAEQFRGGMLSVLSFGLFGGSKIRCPKWRVANWQDDARNIQSDFAAFETGVVAAGKRLLAEGHGAES